MVLLFVKACGDTLEMFSFPNAHFFPKTFVIFFYEMPTIYCSPQHERCFFAFTDSFDMGFDIQHYYSLHQSLTLEDLAKASSRHTLKGLVKVINKVRQTLCEKKRLLFFFEKKRWWQSSAELAERCNFYIFHNSGRQQTKPFFSKSWVGNWKSKRVFLFEDCFLVCFFYSWLGQDHQSTDDAHTHTGLLQRRSKVAYCHH